jgi:hypothetical protein
MGIGKNIIRVSGLIFLLWGTLYAVNFLLTGEFPWIPMEMTHRIDEKEYNISAPIFILVLWVIGVYLIKFKDTARQWGLAILWLFFISYLINLIIIIIASFLIAGSFIKGFSMDIDPIIFQGIAYGFERNIEISNPGMIISILVVLNIIFGSQIVILSSKKNRKYFIAEH